MKHEPAVNELPLLRPGLEIAIVGMAGKPATWRLTGATCAMRWRRRARTVSASRCASFSRCPASAGAAEVINGAGHD